MKVKLPRFEGHNVDASNLKLTGGTLTDRVGALSSGEEVYVIARAVVVDVGHGARANGVMTREHKASIVAAVIVDPDDGAKMLDESMLLADERFGIQNLFGHEGPTEE